MFVFFEKSLAQEVILPIPPIVMMGAPSSLLDSEAISQEEVAPKIPPSIGVEAPSFLAIPKLDDREEACLSSPSIMELSDNRVSIPCLLYAPLLHQR